MINCPARAERVIAIGFQRSARETLNLPGDRVVENAVSTGTGAQSSAWDIGLQEFNSILGTSFASPLYAGVGALGLSSEEPRGYLTSTRTGTLAQFFQRLLRAGIAKRMVEETHKLFKQTLESLPHVHCKIQAHLRPDLSYTDPKSCWSCGIFAEDKYVNAGLFLLSEVASTMELSY